MPQHHQPPPLCWHRWRKVKVEANLLSGYQPTDAAHRNIPLAKLANNAYVISEQEWSTCGGFLRVHKTCQAHSNSNGTSSQSSNVNGPYPFMCRTKKSGAPTPRQLACQTLKCAGRGSRLLMTPHARRPHRHTRGRDYVRAAKSPAAAIINNGTYFFVC